MRLLSTSALRRLCCATLTRYIRCAKRCEGILMRFRPSFVYPRSISQRCQPHTSTLRSRFMLEMDSSSWTITRTSSMLSSPTHLIQMDQLRLCSKSHTSAFSMMPSEKEVSLLPKVVRLLGLRGFGQLRYIVKVGRESARLFPPSLHLGHILFICYFLVTSNIKSG